jgi:hypothetical protein
MGFDFMFLSLLKHFPNIHPTYFDLGLRGRHFGQMPLGQIDHSGRNTRHMPYPAILGPNQLEASASDINDQTRLGEVIYGADYTR